MKKDLGVIFGLFLVVLLLILFGGSYSSTVFLDQNKDASNQASIKQTVNIISGSLNVQAEIPTSANSRKKGLSDRDSLPIDQGMLFVFDSSANHTFWMKDMKFAIDIIWIDEDKKIVHIAENISPEPDKQDAELTRYSSPTPSKFVLELNAGLTKLNNLKVGDLVDFTL